MGLEYVVKEFIYWSVVIFIVIFKKFGYVSFLWVVREISGIVRNLEVWCFVCLGIRLVVRSL